MHVTQVVGGVRLHEHKCSPADIPSLSYLRNGRTGYAKFIYVVGGPLVIRFTLSCAVKRAELSGPHYALCAGYSVRGYPYVGTATGLPFESHLFDSAHSSPKSRLTVGSVRQTGSVDSTRLCKPVPPPGKSDEGV